MKNEVAARSAGKNNIKPLDTLLIEKVMGLKGKANNGEYKVTIPQNDLSIMVDGFKIIPAMIGGVMQQQICLI